MLRQLCNYIPNHLVPQLARETGVAEQARTYDEWSHIVTLGYAQLTHSIQGVWSALHDELHKPRRFANDSAFRSARWLDRDQGNEDDNQEHTLRSHVSLRLTIKLRTVR